MINLWQEWCTWRKKKGAYGTGTADSFDIQKEHDRLPKTEVRPEVNKIHYSSVDTNLNVVTSRRELAKHSPEKLVAILVDAWHPNHQGNEVDAKVRVLLRVIFAGTIKDIVPTGHIIIYTLKKKVDFKGRRQ
jgi:hypothetical protein